MLPRHLLTKLIRTGLAEDIGAGDVTTGAALRGDETGYAQATAKAELVVAGIDVFGEVFLTFDPALKFTRRLGDGERAGKGDLLAEVSGSLASILTAERVALNLFQRMCGIATLTRRYVERIEGTRAKILDTRKTVPGLRFLDKYAVRMGGGRNHRTGLFDMLLIKDNHITGAGGITLAVQRAREVYAERFAIEVEVKDLDELDEALSLGVDRIMLDNMDLETMHKAVQVTNRRIPLEASGNVSLSTVRQIADTGVDYISSGALTHSAPTLDISMKIG